MTMPDFARRFNARPEIQVLRERTNFPINATVETDLALLEAGVDYGLADQLQARWYRSIRAADQRVLWLFESKSDAILFAHKFDGDLKGPVSIEAWQKQA